MLAIAQYLARENRIDPDQISRRTAARRRARGR
jgi:hypothetical protein